MVYKIYSNIIHITIKGIYEKCSKAYAYSKDHGDICTEWFNESNVNLWTVKSWCIMQTKLQILTLLYPDIFRHRRVWCGDMPCHNMDNTSSWALQSIWQIRHSARSTTGSSAWDCPPTNSVWWHVRQDMHGCSSMEMVRPRARSCRSIE